ncbi:FAD-containing oxidoreductase [Aurantimonas sp. 22II-16-19i]|uniref:FAD-containing oxidoreductase n=1 Tax=Aurantimonas sp. 22II-16-19i TaxID=1317114 RepID=UPI0009F8022D|nr:FAD-containing oxidoreductase [Aurantimonas sp. 22II-16-19i]ORE90137.1 mercuric reductase [Aurantimonas sp. 22II-16-19i]
MTRNFDAIIIGAGQAGPSLAGRLTSSGMTVALIERHLVGGTCVNTGCMPTKTLVASAKVAAMARRGGDYGVTLAGDVSVDMRRVRARAETVSRDARQNNERWLEGMDRLTFLRGHARFLDAGTIAVGDETLSAPLIFLNVGGRAIVPDMPGIGDVAVMTNTDIVALDVLPRHLVVIGGSYIGLEFAQMYRRFGAKVTVIEKGPRLVSREDEDVSSAIREILEAEDIHVRTGAECIAFAAHADGVAVRVDCREGSPEIVGSHVLMAVGRRPNTDDLGLDAAGIDTDGRGYIKVDDRLQTNVSGIYALGDCNGRGAFTHTAYNDYEIVAANLLEGGARSLEDRIPAYALYIDPPLGRVGMTETQARASGRPLLISTRPMSRVGRAKEKGETKGFMKLIADAQTRRILGASILGVEGDEAIHGILDVMAADLPYTIFERAVPIHPTVSELIPTLAGDLQPAT